MGAAPPLLAHTTTTTTTTSTLGSASSSPTSSGDNLSDDALNYVAGYVAFKLRREHRDLGFVCGSVSMSAGVNNSWLQQLSRGGLRQPSESWLQTARCLERDFRSYHGSSLRNERQVVSRLVTAMAIKHPLTPVAAIRCFVRTRTFIRMRYLNRKTMNTKRFVTKKIKKVTH